MRLARSLYRILPALLVLAAGPGNMAAARNTPVSSALDVAVAMSTARPGDTLTMVPGSWVDQTIVMEGNGTAAQPIVLRAARYGDVVLSGSSRLRVAGTWLVVDGLVFRGGNAYPDPVIQFRNPSRGTTASDCRVTSCTINAYSHTVKDQDNKWVSIYGYRNRLDHCAMEGKTNLGTTVVVWRSDITAQYHRIDRNYFGPRPELGLNGGETVRVGTSDQSLSASRTIVEENLFDRCNGEVEIISNKSCENIYRYNTFVRCQGTLTLRHGDRCRVEGNFFFGGREPNSGGIRIIGEDHVVINNYVTTTAGNSFKSALCLVNGIPGSPLNGYYQVKRAVVAFNTLVDNATPVTIGARSSTEQTLPPSQCLIANNVIWGTKAPLVTFAAAPESLTWTGNIFYGASTGLSVLPSGNQVVDPKFGVPDSAGVRHLLDGSPAIGAAMALPFQFPVDIDMDGQPRDEHPDVGADEYSGQPILRRPLTRADVGPAVPDGPADVREEPGTGAVPARFRLECNYPNPFNPLTTIPFTVAQGARATLEVFDLAGEPVATLFDGQAEPGRLYSVRFAASHLASGVYYCRLTSGGAVSVIPLMLIR